MLIGGIQREFTIDVVTCEVLAPVYEPLASCEGMTVSFDQFNTPADNYLWDFGVPGTDADTSGLAEPSFTYNTPGEYDISLFFSTGGCSDSLHFSVAVAEPWSAEFDLGALTCTADGSWSMPVAVDTTDWPPGASWTWTLTDGTTLSDTLLTALALPPGLHTTSLLSTWADCEAASEVVVDLPALPVAAFTMTSFPCGDLLVTFEANAEDVITSGPFLWTFGGGTNTATGASVSHAFPTHGTFDVSLTAGVGSACEVVSSQSVTLYSADPLSGTVTVAPLSLCDSTGWMQVDLSGIGADLVTWNFDSAADVIDSDLEGATVVYPLPGTYAASVMLENSACGLDSRLTLEIDVPQAIEGIRYWTPNVISPNNDPDNERFAVMHEGEDGAIESLPNAGAFEQFALRVFNRWGQNRFPNHEPQSRLAR